MFEIKYVEGKKPFYQLNNLYVYQLSCEVADLAADDEISTGIEAVDQSVTDFVFTTTMTMVGVAIFCDNYHTIGKGCCCYEYWKFCRSY